jgi:Protein of unknown function (DUF2029).
LTAAPDTMAGMASDSALRTTPPTTPGRGMLSNPLALWIGFLVVHLVVGYLALIAPGARLGDVTTVYLPWALQARGGFVMGIDAPWVYPVVAIVPIMIPLVFGARDYVGAWLTLALLLDAAAFAVLVLGRHRRSTSAAWWWLGFTLLLGPVAISRLDTLSVPIVIVGLLWLGLRPRLATVLLTIATWIKVWPAAVLASLVIATHHRWRVIAAAVVTSAVFVVLALAFGAGANVFSFVSAQTDRGLQVEAPISGIWMWESVLGRPGSFVYYDQPLNTFEVTGDGIDAAIALMSPLLAIAVLVVLLLGIRAARRGRAMTLVLPSLALAVVTALIAFNKVGSPQYMVWLVAPVVLGLVYQGRGFRTPAILVAIMAALTQTFYPYLYDGILMLNPALLVVLTLRNLLLFAVLGWAILALWRGEGAVHDAPLTPEGASVWPFAPAEPSAMPSPSHPETLQSIEKE